MKKSQRTGRLLTLLAGVCLAAGVVFAPPAVAQDARALEGEKIKFRIERPKFVFHGVEIAYAGAIRYSWRTNDLSAVAGEDYHAAEGKVTFAGDAGLREVSIETIPDGVDEGEGESFELILFNPETKNRADQGWKPTHLVVQRVTMRGLILDCPPTHRCGP